MYGPGFSEYIHPSIRPGCTQVRCPIRSFTIGLKALVTVRRLTLVATTGLIEAGSAADEGALPTFVDVGSLRTGRCDARSHAGAADPIGGAARLAYPPSRGCAALPRHGASAFSGRRAWRSLHCPGRGRALAARGASVQAPHEVPS